MKQTVENRQNRVPSTAQIQKVYCKVLMIVNMSSMYVYLCLFEEATTQSSAKKCLNFLFLFYMDPVLYSDLCQHSRFCIFNMSMHLQSHILILEWTLCILMLLKLLKRGLNIEKCKAKKSIVYNLLLTQLFFWLRPQFQLQPQGSLAYKCVQMKFLYRFFLVM